MKVEYWLFYLFVFIALSHEKPLRTFAGNALTGSMRYEDQNRTSWNTLGIGSACRLSGLVRFRSQLTR
ncbi:hypothetical protein EHE22_14245 [Ochrobactrum pseudogrignonense]|uniref:Uncharacterized protein n=1 Tax=Brucella pseudogrignonensis TaxID=419475 RepID=A0A7Y3T612_9HYPH|nr:hypothetical protein [Brucella pseudogrignonensis]